MIQLSGTAVVDPPSLEGNTFKVCGGREAAADESVKWVKGGGASSSYPTSSSQRVSSVRKVVGFNERMRRQLFSVPEKQGRNMEFSNFR